MLAILTLIEWHSLDRDPVKQEILSPFIERHIALSVHDMPVPGSELPSLSQGSESVSSGLQQEVTITFNGPLFLVYFFGPILAFQAIGWLLARLKARLETTE
jgi:hypothetical protein